MKRILILSLVTLMAVAGLVEPVFAQQAAPATNVTLTGARGDAGSRCDSATSGTQATLTFVQPPAGNSNYITMLAVWGLASGVPTAATPTQSTMTGIAGTSPKVMPLASVYPAAGAQGSVSGGFVPMATPIKASANTANTVVGPTAITNMTQEIDSCYYVAP